MTGLTGLVWSELAEQLAALPEQVRAGITEIRLRRNYPVMVRFADQGELFLVPSSDCEVLQEKHFQTVLQKISRNSPYAYEEELKQGFITMDGGIRVGLTGQAVVESGEVQQLRALQAMNIRVPREVKGCASKVLPFILSGQAVCLNTLILAPPGCGKTTLLRDMIRQLSSGYGGRTFQVGVVDERSELAALYQGKPTLDLGPRTDVMDRCPKAAGMMMLLRSMAPDILVTDELGRPEDVAAVLEALYAGVAVITTVHGRSLEDLKKRPQVAKLYEAQIFDRIILLGSKPKVGSLQCIWDGSTAKVLYEGGEKQHEYEVNGALPDSGSGNLAGLRLCQDL